MEREKRSPEVLIEDSDLVVRMAAEGYQKCLKHGGLPKIVMNSLVVAFAVHFRNVMDFLYSGQYKRPPAKTDVIAEDFFDSSDEWHSLAPACSASARINRVRLNKQIAHLIYDKVGLDDEAKLWHFRQVLDDLSLGIEALYNNFHSRYFLNFETDRQHLIWKKRIKINQSVNRKMKLVFKKFNNWKW